MLQDQESKRRRTKSIHNSILISDFVKRLQTIQKEDQKIKLVTKISSSTFRTFQDQIFSDISIIDSYSFVFHSKNIVNKISDFSSPSCSRPFSGFMRYQHRIRNHKIQSPTHISDTQLKNIVNFEFCPTLASGLH